MAYQNVPTPRFYIDKSIYFRTTGQFVPETDFEANFTDLNPSRTMQYDFSFGIDMPTFGSPLNYVAFLGHDAGRMYMEWMTEDGTTVYNVGQTEIVNYHGSSDFTMEGYTLLEFPYDDTYPTIRAWVSSAGGGTYMGAISIGNYFDMPVAPDMTMSLEHDYSGIKKTTSMSGASFSNANWIKPPKWGDLEAWQLAYAFGEGYYKHPRLYSGRRIWDLSFSYMSDSDLEPRNYTGTTTSLYPGDDNWFENVLHYTMGGHLPFVFQPNKDATYEAIDSNESGTLDYLKQIPEFAICRLDMNSFKREQVAPGVYNIKIKVKETW